VVAWHQPTCISKETNVLTKETCRITKKICRFFLCAERAPETNKREHGKFLMQQQKKTEDQQTRRNLHGEMARVAESYVLRPARPQDPLLVVLLYLVGGALVAALATALLICDCDCICSQLGFMLVFIAYTNATVTFTHTHDVSHSLIRTMYHIHSYAHIKHTCSQCICICNVCV